VDRDKTGLLGTPRPVNNGGHRKKAATRKSVATMITVIRLHLTICVGLLDFIKDAHQAWRKTDKM